MGITAVRCRAYIGEDVGCGSSVLLLSRRTGLGPRLQTSSPPGKPAYCGYPDPGLSPLPYISPSSRMTNVWSAYRVVSLAQRCLSVDHDRCIPLTLCGLLVVPLPNTSWYWPTNIRQLQSRNLAHLRFKNQK